MFGRCQWPRLSSYRRLKSRFQQCCSECPENNELFKSLLLISVIMRVKCHQCSGRLRITLHQPIRIRSFHTLFYLLSLINFWPWLRVSLSFYLFIQVLLLSLELISHRFNPRSRTWESPWPGCSWTSWYWGLWVERRPPPSWAVGRWFKSLDTCPPA